MKSFRFWLFSSLTLTLFYPVSCAAQKQPLNPEWLAADYGSIELVSLLSSPEPLTTQRIRDILRVEGDGEEDLGFGASLFDIGKGHGYTSLYVEGFVFRGAIGVYSVGIRASRENWPQIRERVIDLWKQNHGPDFDVTDTGLVHTEMNHEVLRRYQSSVSAELGEMRRADVPAELNKAFDYLTSPVGNRAIGDSVGERAIASLLNSERVDLLENVLRGFNPSGRVYAALALLKLSKKNGFALSDDTVSTIAKVSNLDIPIITVRGCIVNSRTAKEIFSEPVD